jgi:hypothetical protein
MRSLGIGYLRVYRIVTNVSLSVVSVGVQPNSEKIREPTSGLEPLT